MPTSNRIGVFGGTFDPVHIGHLIIAEIMQQELGLGAVLFLPAGRPPHKPEQELAADNHRLAMLTMAIHECPDFSISTIDLDRPGSSYTATSLEHLTQELKPECELYFLMGQDSLRDFHRWREPGRIVSIARLGVALRPNVNVSIEAVNEAVPETTGRVELVHVPLIDISSRDIRHRIRSGNPFRFQVPHGVANYIASHGLYQYRESSE